MNADLKANAGYNAGSFYNCSLSSIKLPYTIATIYAHTFRESNIQNINLDNIIEIQDAAFYQADLSGFTIDAPKLSVLSSNATFNYTNIEAISNLGSVE